MERVGELALPLVAAWSLRRAPASDFRPARSLAGDERPAPLAPAAAAATDWFDIAAPTTVAAALRALGRWSFDAPVERFDADDWWFRARFDTPPPGVRALAFEGLAGLCEAWLNGEPLLASANMFVAHRREQLPGLRINANELLLRFAALDRWLAERRPRPRWRAPMVESQQLRHTRTTLLGRTPGWSPPAAAVGPWRPIEWRAAGAIEAHGLRIESTLDGDEGVLKVSAELVGADGRACADLAELVIERAGRVCTARFARRHDRHEACLREPHAARWWPHTHGEPALYAARIVVTRASGPPLTIELGRIGFRRIDVDRDDDGFAIRVNGVAVDCHGACWMPLDVVSLATTAEACRAAVEQARDAGLNMLRIVGSTVYEAPHFHAACDEFGMLVWQDFMFANMDYPEADAAFAATVGAEAEQQLERWQAHPSLAVLCGNSEAEQQAAMWGAPRPAWSQPLFERDLAELAAVWCPGVPYWPSSAHGGAFPHQNDVGTTSYYGVGAYLRPLIDARHSDVRFATECLAIAQVPSPATLARWPGGATARAHHPAWKARVPRDLGAGWDFEDVRDHYLKVFYAIDPVALRSVDHERYLALSRAVGAELMQATFATWRRPDSRCRGAVVWWLRDLWPSCGFGLVDDAGMPKAAWHGVRRALAPIAVSFSDEGTNGIDVHVVNATDHDLDASLEIVVHRDDGLRVEAAARPVHVAPRSAASWNAAAWFDHFIDLSRAYRFGPAEHALVVATLDGGTGAQPAPAFFFPEGMPSVRRRDVALALGPVVVASDGSATFEVSSERFAQSVHFDIPGWIADDEYFHLEPGGRRRVRLTPQARSTDSRGPPAPRGHAGALNAWATTVLGALS